MMTSIKAKGHQNNLLRDSQHRVPNKASAVKKSNKVRLACEVFLEKETVIEPAPNQTIIKDMVTT